LVDSGLIRLSNMLRAVQYWLIVVAMAEISVLVCSATFRFVEKQGAHRTDIPGIGLQQYTLPSEFDFAGGFASVALEDLDRRQQLSQGR